MIGPASSLALRSWLKSAAAKAGLDRPFGQVTGLTPPALALHVACLTRDTPVFLVVPTDADVEQVVADARLFLAALEGLSNHDVARRVLPLPSLEVDPYRGLAPHLEVASARARALHALATGAAALVVASARALVPRLSDPVRLASTGLTLEPGAEIAPQELGERLAHAGFLPEDPVDEPGEFCVRGGVVDVYPALDARPIRLEFIGDIIESVREFDGSTQRSLAALGRVVITPQRELLTRSGDDPADRDRSATITDYLQQAGARTVVFEIDDVEERGRGLETQWRASAAEMASRGRAVPSYEALATDWDGLTAWLAGANRVSQLAVGADSDGGVHVSTTPTLEYHGRIGDWAAEVRRGRDRGDTILFVADTPGRAERITELLADYEIRAQAIGTRKICPVGPCS